MDLGVNVEQLNKDKRGECYGHDVRVAIVEEHESEHNDYTTLVDRLPNPNSESFEVQTASLL